MYSWQIFLPSYKLSLHINHFFAVHSFFTSIKPHLLIIGHASQAVWDRFRKSFLMPIYWSIFPTFSSSSLSFRFYAKFFFNHLELICARRLITLLFLQNDFLLNKKIMFTSKCRAYQTQDKTQDNHQGLV